MDIKNKFHTEGTYRHMRLEHVAVVVICSAMVLANYREVNWWRFVGAFAVIDLIGYIPGAIVYRRRGDRPFPPIYHHLYNFMHSYLTAMTLTALWYWAAGGFEWAMLAFPIHLSGDRGIFGNVFKPVALSFEPVTAAGPVVPEGLRMPRPSTGDAS